MPIVTVPRLLQHLAQPARHHTRFPQRSTVSMQTPMATISQPPTEQLKALFKAFLASSPQIILGTQSSSRRAIMDELAAEYGFEYTCEVAGIDEEAIRHPDPAQLVLLLARAKAEAILAKLAAQQVWLVWMCTNTSSTIVIPAAGKQHGRSTRIPCHL